MAISIKDIAKIANVSIATVSRVINYPEKVSGEKKRVNLQNNARVKLST